MCGIAGYVGYGKEGLWHSTHRIMTELLLASQSRGTDATGFAALPWSSSWGTAKDVLCDKAPEKASEFIQTKGWRKLKQKRACSVLAHVRAATSGSPLDNRNNHPFAGQLGRHKFSLVHNGIFTNVREICDRDSLKMQTDCDSEVAVRLIEKSRNISDGLYRCISELRGSMALAVLDHSTGAIWCIRDHHRPLWTCRLRDGRVFFASTAEILGSALAKAGRNLSEEAVSFQPLAEYHVHVLTPDGRIIAPYWKKMDIGCLLGPL